MQAVGAGVAVVASLAGVVVTLERLTVRPRLMRTAETARQLAAQESDPERKRALTSVQDLAVGRLVSEWVMPGWTVAISAGLAFVGPVVVGSAFYENGISEDAVRLAFVFALLLAINTQKPIHLTLGRQTMVRDYMAGRRVVRHPTTSVPKWGEYLWSCVISAGSVCLGAGVGLAIRASDHHSAAWLIVLGGLVTAFALDLLRLSGPLAADPENESVSPTKPVPAAPKSQRRRSK